MPKRLYRSRNEKMIGGVANGLSNYFDIDPVIIRGLFIITTLAWGIGLLSYIVMWIIVPYDTNEYYTTQNTSNSDSLIDNNNIIEDEYDKAKRRYHAKIYVAIIMISLGILLLISEFLPQFRFEFIIAILLIIMGLTTLIFNFKNFRS